LEKANIEVDIEILKNEMAHINKHLIGIDKAMQKLQDLMLEQNDLRKDITAAIQEHKEMRGELSGFGKRLSDNEKEIREVKERFNNIPIRLKSSVVDYVWKYAALAIGGWIALKITGILP